MPDDLNYFPSLPPGNQGDAARWGMASDEEILETDLLIALGLETLSQEDKAELINRMTLTVQKAVALRVLDGLEPGQKEELNRLLERGEPESLDQFLLLNVPGFADLIKEETVKFKRAMLTGERSVTAQPPAS